MDEGGLALPLEWVDILYSMRLKRSGTVNSNDEESGRKNQASMI
ncbi:MAG: hypothetical protein RR961_08770 [Eubacterium sp.]